MSVIDPATGLPPLPEGCVWVIEPYKVPGDDASSVWVRLMRDGRDLGGGITSPHRDHVVSLAQEVLACHAARTAAHDAVAALCGTYPPGRLP